MTPVKSFAARVNCSSEPQKEKPKDPHAKRGDVAEMGRSSAASLRRKNSSAAGDGWTATRAQAEAYATASRRIRSRGVRERGGRAGRGRGSARWIGRGRAGRDRRWNRGGGLVASDDREGGRCGWCGRRDRRQCLEFRSGLVRGQRQRRFRRRCGESNCRTRRRCERSRKKAVRTRGGFRASRV